MMVIRTFFIPSSAFLVVASIASEIAIEESWRRKGQPSDPPNNEDSSRASDISLNDQLLESDILKSKFGIQRPRALHSSSSITESGDLKSLVRIKRQSGDSSHISREKRQGLLPSEEENGETIIFFLI